MMPFLQDPILFSLFKVKQNHIYILLQERDITLNFRILILFI